MVNKIRAYIEHEFAEVPENRKVRELKEELTANLIEKYNEQLLHGKSEEEAYNAVIIGLGDLSELVDSVRPHSCDGPGRQERKRSAMFTASAVMLYILSPVMIILFESIGLEILGLVLFFGFIAGATGLLIYDHMTRPAYEKQDENIVEDFKEWRAKTNRQRRAFRAFHSAYWSLVVVVYFLYSFLCSSWGYSWILFIAAAAVENIVKGVMQMKEERL